MIVGKIPDLIVGKIQRKDSGETALGNAAAFLQVYLLATSTASTFIKPLLRRCSGAVEGLLSLCRGSFNALLRARDGTGARQAQRPHKRRGAYKSVCVYDIFRVMCVCVCVCVCVDK